MDRLYGGSLNHHIEELAEHALRAEAWEPAADYLLQAAGRAEERSAYSAAVQFLESARKAVAALPRNPKTLAQAINLRVRMRPAYGALGATGRRCRSCWKRANWPWNWAIRNSSPMCCST
jgi:hypothetical protein